MLPDTSHMTLYSNLTALDLAAKAAGSWFSEHLMTLPTVAWRWPNTEAESLVGGLRPVRIDVRASAERRRQERRRAAGRIGSSMATWRRPPAGLRSGLQSWMVRPRSPIARRDVGRSTRSGAVCIGSACEPGEVVSWQLPNWHEAFLLHHAMLRIGAVSNPIVPIYRAHEVEYMLTRGGQQGASSSRRPSAASTTSRWLNRLRPVLPELRHVVTVRPRALRSAVVHGSARGEDAPARRRAHAPDDPDRC